jgi:CubicO group peptidase (beta-lactamase class C family)
VIRKGCFQFCVVRSPAFARNIENGDFMKTFVRLCVALLALFSVVQAQQVLPQLAPAEVGFAKDRLDRIRVRMEKEIAENRLSGGIGLIARRGKIAYFETYGMADKEAGKPMTRDAIFRIYSMTKAVTGVAVMILYEEGRFSLTDPVSRYLPEFTTMKVAVEKTDPTGKRFLSHTVPAERQITILDLLRHTSGFNYDGPRDEKGESVYQRMQLNLVWGADFPLSEFVKRLAQAPLVHQPGTTWDYSYSMDVLGRLVEVVSGQSLDQFYADRILKPLRMEDTSFYVPEPKWNRLVTMYTLTPDGTITRAPEAMQEGARKKPILLLGGAGLMSTAMDYARFVQMLVNGGELDGVRILSPRTVDLMRTDVLGNMRRANDFLPPRGYGFGLTFAVNRGPAETASIVSKGEYNWGGAAGTSFWIDPQEKLTGVMMIQTLLDLTKAGTFKQLAYQAIVEDEKK